MNTNTVEKNRLLADLVIRGLESRNMTGYYAETKEEALKMALELIPEGSKVARGGSFTVNEIGLSEALSNGRYDFCNREIESDKKAAELFAYTSDFYIGSVNAMTEDGVLINIDGNSNRVSSYAYGPKKLLLIVGMNKIAKDVDAAMKRARNTAAPVNMTRFPQKNAPCKKTGTCMNCKSPDTICCQILITRYSAHKDRIHVILVNEDLGF
ncbi:MAG: lactate utilization protein [Lachnospiraceae bacterium]|nr:lactate utilization protein [Lachnospiraceae bacterium]